MITAIKEYLFNIKRRIFFLVSICIILIIISSFLDFDIPVFYRIVPLFLLLVGFLSIPVVSKYENIIRTLTILVILFTNTISEIVFVGRPIAYEYFGQDAGTIELYLFEDGQCKICYGGIFGVTKQFFGEYRIEGNNIRTDIADKLLDMKGRTIEINKRIYTIEQ